MKRVKSTWKILRTYGATTLIMRHGAEFDHLLMHEYIFDYFSETTFDNEIFNSFTQGFKYYTV